MASRAQLQLRSSIGWLFLSSPKLRSKRGPKIVQGDLLYQPIFLAQISFLLLTAFTSSLHSPFSCKPSTTFPISRRMYYSVIKSGERWDTCFPWLLTLRSWVCVYRQTSGFSRYWKRNLRGKRWRFFFTSVCWGCWWSLFEVLDDPHRHIYNRELITMIRLFKRSDNLWKQHGYSCQLEKLNIRLLWISRCSRTHNFNG